MNEPLPSYSERIQTIVCPVPLRKRYDEQIVESFLGAWQQGRFSHRRDWQDQQRLQVGVLASDAGGVRVAVEYTRVFRFEDQEQQEELLRPIGQTLASEPKLDIKGRHFAIRLHPKFLGKLLPRFEPLAARELRTWAFEALPGLAVSDRPYRFHVPIRMPQGKTPAVAVDVSVQSRSATMPPVSMHVYPADDAERLKPAIRRALKAKLPGLIRAAAEQRVLLVDVPTTGSAGKVIDVIRSLGGSFPLLEQLDYIVVADTSAYPSRGPLVFSLWATAVAEWSEILRCVFETPSGELVLRAPGTLASLADQARDFAAAAKAPNTVRAYASDWNDFREWCESHEVRSLPAEPASVALYLTDRAASLKTSSLARRLTAISRVHQASGHLSPAALQHIEVSEVWKGIKRQKGTAEEGKKPFLTADLRLAIERLPANLLGLRDRALLLVGFAGGFRRSELAGLSVEDLRDSSEGIIIRLGRSKTDQEGEGRRVGLPYGSDPLTCPVRALRAWTKAARITSGPLFRGVDQFGFVSERKLHSDSIAFIVKRAAGKAALNVMEYAGHSLRAGLATQAAMNGAGELSIMKQTGHRSLATVRKYIREGSLFRDNAATKLGL
jgi:site-specific recombinase XerD